MTEVIDLSGHRFGNLTVIDRGESKNKYAAWVCRCDCGQRVTVNSNYLRRGHKRSCGIGGHIFVSPDKKVVFSDYKRPEYGVWSRMKKRCLNPNHERYKNYGGRGIVVCNRWRESFAAFFEDMGERPSPAHSIERNDNDGNYEPSNCRWATMAEQKRNMRKTVYVEWNGHRERLIDLVEEMGLKASTVYGRLKIGWDLDSALTIPVREKRRKISLDD